MRKIILLSLIVISCNTSYKRFAGNTGMFDEYFKTIDDYPDKKKFDKIVIEFGQARGGNDADLKVRKEKELTDVKKAMADFLNERIKSASINFQQINKNILEVVSLKTTQVFITKGDYEVDPCVNLTLEYKPLREIEKYDYVRVEFLNSENKILWVKNAMLNDSNKIKIKMNLSNISRAFEKIIIE